MRQKSCTELKPIRADSFNILALDFGVTGAELGAPGPS